MEMHLMKKDIEVTEKPDDDPEESSLAIDQDFMKELEYSFDNHTFK